MYNVMLVDDEKLITQGLLKLIEWEELGLKVTYTAENGQEALEHFKNDPVDIVISDINMPKMTGLEFIQEVHKLNRNVKFIILSGYDDFAYAREAIKYKVENYILKPIDENELKEALSKIIVNLNDIKLSKNNSIEKASKFLEFVNGRIDKEKLYEIKEYINIGLNESVYTVGTIIINKGEAGTGYVNIHDIIRNNTKDGFEIVYKLDGRYILINSWNKSITRDQTIEYYKRIRNKLTKELEFDVFIAIGDNVDSIENLKESYRVATNLESYILTEGTDRCISREDLSDEEESVVNFTTEIDNIKKLIIERESNKLKTYVTGIFDNYKLTPKNIYDISIKIILLIDEVSGDFKLYKKYSRDSLSNTIVALCNENTRENIKTFIISELEELIKYMNMSVIKYSPVVQQIINNVNDRYYEELSLKTLAQQYNINTSYLGQIFTKEVGLSFSEYLNKIKNSKAKDLILNTNMKINDIAKAVGYIDTSYFYRKFKKYYGVCPSTLREMKNY